MSDSDKQIRAPTWDGTDSRSGQYLAKTKALAVYYGYGDTLMASTMRDLPTQSEYALLPVGTTDVLEKKKQKLYDDNKRMAAIIVLGQQSDHGLSMMESTVTADQPHGVVHEFLTQVKIKYKPEDASAVIEMDIALEKLQMKGTANDFYNDVIGIQAKFGCKKDDIGLITVMAKKVKNTTHAKSIVDHLNDLTKPNSFETLCREITAVQRLASAFEPTSQGGKETQLTSYDKMNGGGTFTGTCGNCKTVCGYKRKDCPHPKAKGSNGGSGNDGQNKSKKKKTCNHCGKVGHYEAACWIKNPDLKPQWIKEKEKKSNEASGTSVELMCTTIDVPDGRTEGDKAFNSVMEFMRANPDLHVEPIDANGFYKNDEQTEEELAKNKRIKLESDDMGLARDFWHAR